jgi:hypothetical protein
VPPVNVPMNHITLQVPSLILYPLHPLDPALHLRGGPGAEAAPLPRVSGRSTLTLRRQARACSTKLRLSAQQFNVVSAGAGSTCHLSRKPVGNRHLDLDQPPPL